MSGYNLYRKDRVNRKGGRVAVYVHSNLNSAELCVHADGYSDNIEITWVQCEHRSLLYYIAASACYHPPRQHYPDELLKL